MLARKLLLSSLALLLLSFLTLSNCYGQTRLGLHVTKEELALWRERIKNGPYRIGGDVSTYSPGDWQRIQSYANAFLSNPTAHRWKGPTVYAPAGTIYKGVNIGGKAYARDGSNEPMGNAIGRHIRDAAFVYLVDKNHPKRAALKAAIKQELLYGPATPNVDFTNQTKWPRTYYRDVNPIFQIMNWFNCYLFALDYIDIADGEDGVTTFTAQERERLYKWFTQAAEFARYENDWDLDRNFTNRQSLADDADYTTAWAHTPAQRNGRNLTTHYTASGPGKTVYGLMRTMNNRRMASLRYACLVGLKTNNVVFVASAKRFVKDWIKYSVFEDGTMGEMERWGSLPDLGWAYCTDVIASAITIADALARTGDASLFTYSTTIGKYGTEAKNGKGILTTLKMMYKITAKQVKWYGTNLPGNVSSAYLIDGQHTNWKALHDVWLTQGNLYYKDSEVKAMYMRNGAGMDRYWQNPSYQGRHPVWTGDWGIFPGVLLMFGQMEDKPRPYPAQTSGTPKIVITPTLGHINCNGLSNGTISVTATGGTAPYSYLWSTGATTASISGLKAGTYSVTVTDKTGNKQSKSVTLTQPAAIALTTQVSNETDAGKDGAIALTVSGGTAPYKYSWSNGATTEDIATLAAGTYSVTVTDQKNCSATQSVSLTKTTSQQIAVLSFTLIDADKDQPMANYDPLQDGDTINLALLSTRNLNIRANTTSATEISRVQFALNANATFRNEIAAPYSLAGDNQSNYYAWQFTTGKYTLTATPYSSAKLAQKPLTITFYIVNQSVNPEVAPVAEDNAIKPSVLFSPNGDGINDLWKIENIELHPDYQVTIFNATGKIVYDAKPYLNNWDGTAGSQVLPADAYYYIVKDSSNKPIKTGTVTLIR